MITQRACCLLYIYRKASPVSAEQCGLPFSILERYWLFASWSLVSLDAVVQNSHLGGEQETIIIITSHGLKVKLNSEKHDPPSPYTNDSETILVAEVAKYSPCVSAVSVKCVCTAILAFGDLQSSTCLSLRFHS